ncbi:MAG: preprotein translocase subunit SecG [Tenericutes bacterium]|nr:preprotein translocase subunit SecG [Mycoplasmatota bacterium]MDD7630002.1 preprotein translocase subunit SecG [bacterium]MDO4377259.1 preprotein translocase subunit SecG [bacterium]MDY4108787.1 preprotein translocase subunit SecG [Bacilli bacterium]
METLIMIISILLIVIVLLQSSKAEGGFINSSGSELFANRKERGSELFITRLTAVLGAAFFIIALIMSL